MQKIGINFVPANAGFFVYADLSPYLMQDTEDAEFNLAQRFLDAGVFLHPKEEHGERGWFRMIFTQDRSTIVEGLRR